MVIKKSKMAAATILGLTICMAASISLASAAIYKPGDRPPYKPPSDKTRPIVQEVKTIGFTNDSTPTYSFTSSEAGSIYYPSFNNKDLPCSSDTNTMIKGLNTITFNFLKDGIYNVGLNNGCILQVYDKAGNYTWLYVTTFTVDTKAPFIEEKIKVPSPTNDTTPDYTFSSTEKGKISYPNSPCTSVTTDAYSEILNKITFNPLTKGTYSGANNTECFIQVKDAAGNLSNKLGVSDFTIDNEAPVLTIISPLLDYPNFPFVSKTIQTITFNTTKAGSLEVGNSCTTDVKNVLAGDNTITVTLTKNEGPAPCWVNVTDGANNKSNYITYNFNVLPLPILEIVTPIPDPTFDTSPSFTISSNVNGILTVAGSCKDPLNIGYSFATQGGGGQEQIAVYEGNNYVTFYSLPITEDTYADCVLTLKTVTNDEDSDTLPPFMVKDGYAPYFSEVTPVPEYDTDTTPDYTFYTNEAASVKYDGDCSSNTVNVDEGSTKITFNELSEGYHFNCTITLTDKANNVSEPYPVTPFTIYTEKSGFNLEFLDGLDCYQVIVFGNGQSDQVKKISSTPDDGQCWGTSGDANHKNFTAKALQPGDTMITYIYDAASFSAGGYTLIQNDPAFNLNSVKVDIYAEKSPFNQPVSWNQLISEYQKWDINNPNDPNDGYDIVTPNIIFPDVNFYKDYPGSSPKIYIHKFYQ